MPRSGGQADGRKGVTLIELLVVIAIIGLIAGVSGLAFTSIHAPRESAWVRELRRAREEAIRTGKLVRARDPLPPSPAQSRPLRPLFLPDGRAIGPGVDLLTGAPLDSTH